MKKKYIKPEILVIEQVYGEKLMTTLSVGISTTPASGGGDAKPGGDWGDSWGAPSTNGTTTTNDSWGFGK